MAERSGISRRDLLGASIAGGGLALLGATSPSLAQALRRTPAQITGPFYPLAKPLDQDADLTRIAGRPGRAAGQIIDVTGRVLDARGTPLPGVRIEVWQANAHGRYTHASDRNPAPLDPNFEGYALLTSDAEGRYRFRTVKPGAYPADADRMRPSHIHFDVTGRTDRLVTQLYFAGDPYQDDDPHLQGAGRNRHHLIVALQAPGTAEDMHAMRADWDIVLEQG